MGDTTYTPHAAGNGRMTGWTGWTAGSSQSAEDQVTISTEDYEELIARRATASNLEELCRLRERVRVLQYDVEDAFDRMNEEKEAHKISRTKAAVLEAKLMAWMGDNSRLRDEIQGRDAQAFELAEGLSWWRKATVCAISSGVGILAGALFAASQGVL